MPLADLQPAQRFVDTPLAIDNERAAAYVAATADVSGILDAYGVVPPMAVAALALGAAMESVTLPPGAVHTGQEFSFDKAIAPGEPLHCTATVVQNSVRGGRRFFVFDLDVRADGATAVSGRTTIVIDEAGAA